MPCGTVGYAALHPPYDQLADGAWEREQRKRDERNMSEIILVDFSGFLGTTLIYLIRYGLNVYLIHLKSLLKAKTVKVRCQ
ncbi:MAG: hypothetical protein B6245_16985 [Desulfobacteraceae bacterium 4572_88]|nr:MAG: hypothetical protein B6245_16985 [Desulfobacteraceae bacterium 4572_88]RLC19308.1 MAG: hypothetical protein DRI57_07340 [Deltaproteobacteria bacterium]